MKLLRTLRLCRGSVSHAVEEVQQFLAWRKEYGIEEIRDELIRNNYTFEEIREKVPHPDKQHFLPLFGQEPNGDFIDLYGMTPHPEKHTHYIDDYVATYRTI